MAEKWELTSRFPEGEAGRRGGDGQQLCALPGSGLGPSRGGRGNCCGQVAWAYIHIWSGCRDAQLTAMDQ